jgi:hypothetical protein
VAFFVVVHGISFLFYIGYLNVCKKDRRLVGYGRKGAYLVLCFRIKSQIDHKSVRHIRELNYPVVGMNFSVQKQDEVKKISPIMLSRENKVKLAVNS